MPPPLSSKDNEGTSNWFSKDNGLAKLASFKLPMEESEGTSHASRKASEKDWLERRLKDARLETVHFDHAVTRPVLHPHLQATSNQNNAIE